MKINNLDQLLSSITKPALKLIPRRVEWPVKNAAGEVETVELNLFVVDDLTFAASERIYLGDKEFGRNARVISERLRFGPEGKEQMTYAQAAELPDDHGWILVSAVAQYDKEQAEKLKAEQDAKLRDQPNQAENKVPKA